MEHIGTYHLKLLIKMHHKQNLYLVKLMFGQLVSYFMKCFMEEGHLEMDRRKTK
jgi:hypothetical protein